MSSFSPKAHGSSCPSFVVDEIGKLLTMPVEADESARDGGLGCIEDAALAIEEGTIRWVGKARDLPPEWTSRSRVGAGGRVVLPGFVDCHSHIVYGGDRLGDFCRRCQGESYEEILRAGGGIHTTVSKTRSESMDSLSASASRRLHRMRAFGTTTVEIKSGYGLDLETELKMLKVIKGLAQQEAQNIVATFLGAHVVPKEAGSTQEYTELVISQMLPKVRDEGLAEFVDVFCESEAFDVDSSRMILESARDLGFKIKVHAEQLRRTGGTQLAASLGAVSADHLDWASPEDLRAMASAGTVGVLLPSVGLFTGAKKIPEVAEFRAAGVSMALATDSNPGSSPSEDLGLVASLGCVNLGLTPTESLRAITVEAAKALDRGGLVGSLLPGARADLVFLTKDVSDPHEIPYRMGISCVDGVILEGRAWASGAGHCGAGAEAMLKPSILTSC